MIAIDPPVRFLIFSLASEGPSTHAPTRHEGYNVLTETAVESRFALGNGFVGMRAARPVSLGLTWASWLGYIKWASWPRCYVAGLFDTPNTVPPVPALVPVADWSHVRIVLNEAPWS